MGQGFDITAVFAGVRGPGEILAAVGDITQTLQFGPIKLAIFIAWVYLCLYCAQRVAYSPLIAPEYRPIASVGCLLFGPLIFAVLMIADLTVKVQEGDITGHDILRYLFGNMFVGRQTLQGRTIRPEDFIELLDATGKNFFEDIGNKDDQKAADQETLAVTRDIILQGIRRRASDILIDPKGSGQFTVRYRIDGMLHVVREIPDEQGKAVVNSIKAISGMDISEKRRALDGSFMAKISEGNVFFRVASSGVLGGEKLSLRILNQATGMIKLDEVGISPEICATIRESLQQPSGMIVICGPTGSGKTTTLYAMLGEIDFFTRNVVTVEDPIEYVLPNASQIEVNAKANITFANSLRSILRQDPDVICVGEIRDGETADMALQASHTGHLVLATLHSSSNLATLVRMMDLGIKPLVMASALSLVVSQRLVRKLCDFCKQPAELDAETIASLRKERFDPSKVLAPVGCTKCNQTGYLGRTALVDVMKLDDEIKAILGGSHLSLGDLKQKGDSLGRNNLKREGLKKVMAGLTTLDEVKRVVSNLG
ncbi:MAG: type II/IV secretion system protein [Phycisphaerae bacterium]|nr:type II/IV secretion system protein [Phycisphaerae bacterium]